ncbi:MAG TPA: hypothetical protein VHU15_10045 [Stellaceae bacterium]|nr:hypothetical protein [Stellaceae bacterium]
MKRFVTGLCAASVLLASGGAMAQYYQPSYGNDYACRQWADAQVAPYRAQAGANAVGSTLLGAGLGAAIGAAAGGGRGAGIGAASGALLGTVGGAANAQNTEAYAQQQFSALYYQCMQGGPPPAPAYAPAYGAPAYGYPPGYYR